MLSGDVALLRDWRRSDAQARHHERAGDFAQHAVSLETPWVPDSLDDELARFDKRLSEGPRPEHVWFTICDKDDPEQSWLGDGGLWGVNEHQRTAHVGIGLKASARGRGLGTDALRLLCFYAFRIRDLHRLGLETLATNTAMLRAAAAAGFVQEGVDREAAYVLGQRVDEVRLGLLRSEWAPPSE